MKRNLNVKSVWQNTLLEASGQLGLFHLPFNWSYIIDRSSHDWRYWCGKSSHFRKFSVLNSAPSEPKVMKFYCLLFAGLLDQRHDLRTNLEFCSDYFIDLIRSLRQASRSSNTVSFRFQVPKLVFRAKDAQLALNGWRLKWDIHACSNVVLTISAQANTPYCTNLLNEK